MSPNGGEDKIFKAIGTWENVNWRTVEESIFLLQERIFKASNGYEQVLRKGEPTSKARKRLLSLQRRLIMHPYAKLLAVKRVSQQNRGRRTAGVPYC
jgi:RNA-directed DNA polymerase